MQWIVVGQHSQSGEFVFKVIDAISVTEALDKFYWAEVSDKVEVISINKV